MSDLASKNVLVVEDDAFFVRLAQLVLKGLGVQNVETAENGVAALNLLHDDNKKFDLIISDWNMPKMTGLELLQNVRRNWPAMPFLMLTGNANPEFVLAARKHGVNGYIAKPFQPDQLKKRIVAILQPKDG
jgi:two-component system chemotaxis response regulator CheY